MDESVYVITNISTTSFLNKHNRN